MTFLCIHGHMRSACSICVAIDEAVGDFMRPEDESNDAYEEYLYDQYLEMDERMLRENEEGS